MTEERIQTLGRWMLTNAIALELVRRQYGLHDDGFGTEPELIEARRLIHELRQVYTNDAQQIVSEITNLGQVSSDKQFFIEGAIELDKICTDIQNKITRAIIGVRKLDAFIKLYESKKYLVHIN